MIRLDRDVDFVDSGELASLLAQAEQSRLVVIDATQTQYLDSAAIGRLIGLRKTMLRNCGSATVRIVTTSPKLLRIFAIAGLSNVFEFYASLDEALKEPR